MTFSPVEVTGDLFRLERTNARHFAGAGDAPPQTQQRNFDEMLMSSLGDVNQAQKDHANLAVQAVINPDAVDTHDVTIAAAKANLSLSITKNVVDRVIQGYREITSLR
ncbi:MAG: flagellar hook-basal body complex protein FliE [Spirochaetes bacterium]|jgi:flagellar hook-basal body complex protein FliE|nr:flagellar hook-basal body complex protein FliE [Spirochaetota bacterium]